MRRRGGSSRYGKFSITGKSHLAREVAAHIIGCEPDGLKESGQFGFVQFHPSYDYTDFVEGLRPYDEGQGGVGFKLEKGSFMYFVGRAREAQEPKETSSAGASFDDVWDNLVEDVAVAESEGKDYTIDTVRGKPLYLRTAGREGDVLCRGGQAPYFNKEQCRNVYRGEKGVPAGGNDSYRRAIVNRLESDYGLPGYSQESVPSGEEASGDADDRRFVFVIDEINRGDISKIFGELFFSIDPGYRGPAGSVETQYSNMHDDPGWRFYVPDNVYVIGTMNDIDRNVDTFDFAMRRRFRFVEVTAEESQRMLAGKEGEDEAKARMDELNRLICEDDDLGESYEIGASYFLGEGDSVRDDFEDLWDEQLGRSSASTSAGRGVRARSTRRSRQCGRSSSVMRMERLPATPTMVDPKRTEHVCELPLQGQHFLWGEWDERSDRRRLS